MTKLRDRITRKIHHEKNKKIIAQAKEMLQVSNFSIISQNCIGGVFYHDMGMKFLSPTINLYIPEPDFVRMVLDLRRYMESELVVSWGEDYPVGILGDDVKIHFLHYTSCEEALEKWNSRKKRINWDRIIIFATDRDGFNKEVFHLWQQIPFPKILFTANSEYKAGERVILFKEYEDEGMVTDLIPKREFYQFDELVKAINNI